MLKKILILLLFTAPLAGVEDADQAIEISPLTQQIHTRFYVIARIEQTLEALYHLHNTYAIHLSLETISSLKTLSFENHHVKECARNIIKTSSLQPLFQCWQTIITYKNIDDELLPIEFSQLLHHVIEQLVHTMKSPFFRDLKDVLPDIEIPLASTHQVSFRFYLLKRLAKAHTLLQEQEEFRFTADAIAFTHLEVAQCYTQMLAKKSIKPLLKLFAKVERYHFINDSLFAHEFLQLIFITHACLFHNTATEHEEPAFAHISTLSMIELLEAIDIQVNKYEHKKHTVHIMLEENFDFSPNHFAHYVYRRFYFIQRLERIISFFKKAEESIESTKANQKHSADFLNLNTDIMFDFSESFSFKHTRIQESIRSMQHEHNLKPLFSVWDDFISYKSIEDQLFVEEFTKEIFVISRNMLTCSGICARHLPNFRSTIGLPAQQLLDVIDLYIEQILEQTPASEAVHLQIPITPVRTPDLQPAVHIDDVVLRFYHIKRLGIIFWLVNEIQQKSIHLKLSYHQTPQGMLIDNRYHFTHEHVVSVIKIMEQTNSIEPLISLLQGVQRYKYADDPIFTREYLLLTLLSLKHLQIHHRAERAELFEDVPLEKILNALDLIAEELPALLEKYELHGTLNWKEWFKKYWWVPMIVGGSFTIKLYMMLFQNNNTANKNTDAETPPPSIPPALPPKPATPRPGRMSSRISSKVEKSPAPKPKIPAPKFNTQAFESDEE